MTGSPSAIITLGYGFSPSLILTLGYGGTGGSSGVNPSAIRIDLIGTASRFNLKGSPARAGTLEGSEARA